VSDGCSQSIFFAVNDSFWRDIIKALPSNLLTLKESF